MFTHVGLGFRNLVQTSEDGGGGFTERGKPFDDGGSESFDRRGSRHARGDGAISARIEMTSDFSRSKTIAAIFTSRG